MSKKMLITRETERRFKRNHTLGDTMTLLDIKKIVYLGKMIKKKRRVVSYEKKTQSSDTLSL